jgi:hypothetical protein
MSGGSVRDFTLVLSAARSDTQIATAGGAIALHEARELERGVVAGIGRGRTRVVLDLTGVTEVGPGLLGVLLRVRRGVTRVDGAIASPSSAAGAGEPAAGAGEPGAGRLAAPAGRVARAGQAVVAVSPRAARRCSSCSSSSDV